MASTQVLTTSNSGPQGPGWALTLIECAHTTLPQAKNPMAGPSKQSGSP